MSLQTIQTSDCVNWVDLSNPGEDELRQITDEYKLDWHQVKNCLLPDHLPAYEMVGTGYFIMTCWFSTPPKHHMHTFQEMTSKIAIFYSKDFIITIHNNKPPFFEEEQVKKFFKNNNGFSCTANNILAFIVLMILRSYETAAVKLSEQIDEYESTILLKHLKPQMLKGLYYLKRKAGICKRLIMLTGEIVNFVKSLEVDVNTKRDIDDIQLKLSIWYDQIIDDLNNLLNTYLSLSAYKTNDVMKILTIFSVFFMPLTFIVGIYGMNFKFMPELTTKWGYPIVLAIMAMITVGIFLWFRKRKWL